MDKLSPEEMASAEVIGKLSPEEMHGAERVSKYPTPRSMTPGVAARHPEHPQSPDEEVGAGSSPIRSARLPFTALSTPERNAPMTEQELTDLSNAVSTAENQAAMAAGGGLVGAGIRAATAPIAAGEAIAPNALSAFAKGAESQIGRAILKHWLERFAGSEGARMIATSTARLGGKVGALAREAAPAIGAGAGIATGAVAPHPDLAAVARYLLGMHSPPAAGPGKAPSFEGGNP